MKKNRTDLQAGRRNLTGLFTCLFLWAVTSGGYAQSFVADSLRKELNRPDLSREARTLCLAHLARSLYETDMPAAIRYGTEALELSNAFRDGQYKAFVLTTLGYLSVQQDSLLRAQRYLDSALFYAEKTRNNEIRGYVWFRNGWLEYIVDNTDKAMSSLLKALELLQGQHSYEYESLIYHYLASIYSDLKDVGKLEKYTELSLSAAYRSGNPDVICNAYLAQGSSFMEKFRQDTTQKPLLDSSLSYNRRLLALADAYPERIINHANAGAAALNIANVYWEFYPKAYKDSAEKYINIALNIARRAKHEEIIANCYGILSEYAMADGDYAAAEKMFVMGLAEIEGSPSSSKQVKAAMMKGLASVAEKRGDKARALDYYKRYMNYAHEAYNADKLSIAQKLEVQYESEKKDKELEVLQERAAWNRRLNYIYIGLAIASLLALIFLFRSYHFRLRASIQQQKLRDEEAARLKAEQELLQERQDRLQKELLAGTLQVEEKNELLQNLKDKLAEQAADPSLKKQVERMIKENNRLDADFEQAKTHFAEIHPDFFARLQEKAGNTLTRLDQKYCSYILMGLSNKEIATRLGVDPKSIRMARYRIKQKLQLGKEDNLDELIRKMS
ncbi:helix-turn-helix transcriptional regulator [Niabella beijingensis]|uniref:helix-turn-helix transcriptional regulator n=1 Tax=Niabella beijingensis TaxID=2872700 RepID=UPI001CBF2262|nr:LuxR C-terminal-related transcriptional regulator [Niabella beijingensis]MBZ4192183.1 LuxR C-terminal-related transcriptional regulator [Niabella beijingensis]